MGTKKCISGTILHKLQNRIGMTKCYFVKLLNLYVYHKYTNAKLVDDNY